MSKKTFEERLREDRRLVLLRLLSELPGKRSNSSILHAGLTHMHIVAGRHDVVDDLHHLQLHALVKLEALGDVNTTLYGVHLRARGQEVVDGVLTVPGVSTPSLR